MLDDFNDSLYMELIKYGTNKKLPKEEFNVSELLDFSISSYIKDSTNPGTKILRNIEPDINICFHKILIEKIIKTIISTGVSYHNDDYIIAGLKVYDMHSIIFFVENISNDFQIGLILKKLIESLDGHITLDYEASRFEIIITNCLVTAMPNKIYFFDENVQIIKKNKEVIFDRAKKTILLFEENIILQEIMVQELDSRYNIYIAKDRISGIELINKMPRPDLILIDLDYYLESEAKIFLFILDKDPGFWNIPVLSLLLPALTQDHIKFNHRIYNIRNYIEKPYDFEDLILKIEGIINFSQSGESDILGNEEKYEYNMEEIKKRYPLSEIQLLIIDHIMKGKKNKEIGEELNLTEGTIKIYINKIFKILGVENRVELINIITGNV